MDVGLAFRYARGAVWHLEVAAPQLHVAAQRAAGHADELVGVAAGHLDAAAADLTNVAANGPIDAGLGATLAAAGRRLHDDPRALHDVIPVVEDARQHAQRGLNAIAPRLDSPQELLSLTPATQAPAHELALLTSVDEARALTRTSDLQRAQIQRILADGTIDPEPIRYVGGYGNGNGQLAMVRVRHPETPHLSVTAVQRPPMAQAAQEEFFARLTEHAGLDHYYAPVARREDGSALVLAVPGGQLWDDVHGGDDLTQLIARGYRQRFPSLTEDQVQHAARIDFDELKSLDYLTAQPDRNAGSPMGDAASGVLHFIDNGLAGRGETRDVLRPALKSHFVGEQPGHATLHADAARELTSRLDDAALADAHAVLRRGPDGDLPAGHAGALAEDASARFLTNLRTRRDQLARGSFDYEPIPLNADPLAHVSWVRNQSS